MNCCMLMTETIEGLRNKFIKWKEAFESKVLKVNLGNPRSVAKSQRMACLKVKMTHVESKGLLSFVSTVW